MDDLNFPLKNTNKIEHIPESTNSPSNDNLSQKNVKNGNTWENNIGNKIINTSSDHSIHGGSSIHDKNGDEIDIVKQDSLLSNQGTCYAVPLNSFVKNSSYNLETFDINNVDLSCIQDDPLSKPSIVNPSTTQQNCIESSNILAIGANVPLIDTKSALRQIQKSSNSMTDNSLADVDNASFSMDTVDDGTVDSPFTANPNSKSATSTLARLSVRIADDPASFKVHAYNPNTSYKVNDENNEDTYRDDKDNIPNLTLSSAPEDNLVNGSGSANSTTIEKNMTPPFKNQHESSNHLQTPSRGPMRSRTSSLGTVVDDLASRLLALQALVDGSNSCSSDSSSVRHHHYSGKHHQNQHQSGGGKSNRLLRTLTDRSAVTGPMNNSDYENDIENNNNRRHHSSKNHHSRKGINRKPKQSSSSHLQRSQMNSKTSSKQNNTLNGSDSLSSNDKKHLKNSNTKDKHQLGPSSLINKNSFSSSASNSSSDSDNMSSQSSFSSDDDSENSSSNSNDPLNVILRRGGGRWINEPEDDYRLRTQEEDLQRRLDAILNPSKSVANISTSGMFAGFAAPGNGVSQFASNISGPLGIVGSVPVSPLVPSAAPNSALLGPLPFAVGSQGGDEAVDIAGIEEAKAAEGNLLRALDSILMGAGEAEDNNFEGLESLTEGLFWEKPGLECSPKLITDLLQSKHDNDPGFMEGQQLVRELYQLDVPDESRVFQDVLISPLPAFHPPFALNLLVLLRRLRALEESTVHLEALTDEALAAAAQHANEAAIVKARTGSVSLLNATASQLSQIKNSILNDDGNAINKNNLLGKPCLPATIQVNGFSETEALDSYRSKDTDFKPTFVNPIHNNNSVNNNNHSRNAMDNNSKSVERIRNRKVHIVDKSDLGRSEHDKNDQPVNESFREEFDEENVKFDDLSSELHSLSSSKNSPRSNFHKETVHTTLFTAQNSFLPADEAITNTQDFGAINSSSILKPHSHSFSNPERHLYSPKISETTHMKDQNSDHRIGLTYDHQADILSSSGVGESGISEEHDIGIKLLGDDSVHFRLSDSIINPLQMSTQNTCHLLNVNNNTSIILHSEKDVPSPSNQRSNLVTSASNTHINDINIDNMKSSNNDNVILKQNAHMMTLGISSASDFLLAHNEGFQNQPLCRAHSDKDNLMMSSANKYGILATEKFSSLVDGSASPNSNASALFLRKSRRSTIASFKSSGHHTSNLIDVTNSHRNSLVLNGEAETTNVHQVINLNVNIQNTNNNIINNNKMYNHYLSNDSGNQISHTNQSLLNNNSTNLNIPIHQQVSSQTLLPGLSMEASFAVNNASNRAHVTALHHHRQLSSIRQHRLLSFNYASNATNSMQNNLMNLTPTTAIQTIQQPSSTYHDQINFTNSSNPLVPSSRLGFSNTSLNPLFALAPSSNILPPNESRFTPPPRNGLNDLTPAVAKNKERHELAYSSNPTIINDKNILSSLNRSAPSSSVDVEILLRTLRESLALNQVLLTELEHRPSSKSRNKNSTKDFFGSSIGLLNEQKGRKRNNGFSSKSSSTRNHTRNDLISSGQNELQCDDNNNKIIAVDEAPFHSLKMKMHHVMERMGSNVLIDNKSSNCDKNLSFLKSNHVNVPSISSSVRSQQRKSLPVSHSFHKNSNSMNLSKFTSNEVLLCDAEEEPRSILKGSVIEKSEVIIKSTLLESNKEQYADTNDDDDLLLNETSSVPKPSTSAPPNLLSTAVSRLLDESLSESDLKMSNNKKEGTAEDDDEEELLLSAALITSPRSPPNCDSTSVESYSLREGENVMKRHVEGLQGEDAKNNVSAANDLRSSIRINISEIPQEQEQDMDEDYLLLAEGKKIIKRFDTIYRNLNCLYSFSANKNGNNENDSNIDKSIPPMCESYVKHTSYNGDVATSTKNLNNNVPLAQTAQIQNVQSAFAPYLNSHLNGFFTNANSNNLNPNTAASNQTSKSTINHLNLRALPVGSNAYNPHSPNSIATPAIASDSPSHLDSAGGVAPQQHFFNSSHCIPQSSTGISNLNSNTIQTNILCVPPLFPTANISGNHNNSSNLSATQTTALSVLHPTAVQSSSRRLSLMLPPASPSVHQNILTCSGKYFPSEVHRDVSSHSLNNLKNYQPSLALNSETSHENLIPFGNSTGDAFTAGVSPSLEGDCLGTTSQGLESESNPALSSPFSNHLQTPGKWNIPELEDMNHHHHQNHHSANFDGDDLVAASSNRTFALTNSAFLADVQNHELQMASSEMLNVASPLPCLPSVVVTSLIDDIVRLFILSVRTSQSHLIPVHDISHSARTGLSLLNGDGKENNPSVLNVLKDVLHDISDLSNRVKSTLPIQNHEILNMEFAVGEGVRSGVALSSLHGVAEGDATDGLTDMPHTHRMDASDIAVLEDRLSLHHSLIVRTENSNNFDIGEHPMHSIKTSALAGLRLDSLHEFKSDIDGALLSKSQQHHPLPPRVQLNTPSPRSAANVRPLASFSSVSSSSNNLIATDKPSLFHNVVFPKANSQLLTPTRANGFSSLAGHSLSGGDTVGFADGPPPSPSAAISPPRLNATKDDLIDVTPGRRSASPPVVHMKNSLSTSVSVDNSATLRQGDSENVVKDVPGVAPLVPKLSFDQLQQPMSNASLTSPRLVSPSTGKYLRPSPLPSQSDDPSLLQLLFKRLPHSPNQSSYRNQHQQQQQLTTFNNFNVLDGESNPLSTGASTHRSTANSQHRNQLVNKSYSGATVLDDSSFLSSPQNIAADVMTSNNKHTNVQLSPTQYPVIQPQKYLYANMESHIQSLDSIAAYTSKPEDLKVEVTHNIRINDVQSIQPHQSQQRPLLLQDIMSRLHSSPVPFSQPGHQSTFHSTPNASISHAGVSPSNRLSPAPFVVNLSTGLVSRSPTNIGVSNIYNSITSFAPQIQPSTAATGSTTKILYKMQPQQSLYARSKDRNDDHSVLTQKFTTSNQQRLNINALDVNYQLNKTDSLVHSPASSSFSSAPVSISFEWPRLSPINGPQPISSSLPSPQIAPGEIKEKKSSKVTQGSSSSAKKTMAKKTPSTSVTVTPKSKPKTTPQIASDSPKKSSSAPISTKKAANTSKSSSKTKK